VIRTQLISPGRLAGPSGDSAAARLGAVLLRPAAPADCEAIKSFVTGLSLRTRFLRFFSPATPPSSAVLRGLCGAGRTTDVIVATHEGVIVGHAMAADSTGPGGARVTDVGLVVADRWQHRGIGSEILARLVARAAARGVRELVMDVLPDNRPMLTMISRQWPGAGYEYGAGSVTVRVHLPDASAAKRDGRVAA
jgi:L-amino acid N-acyltransferase YncA